MGGERRPARWWLQVAVAVALSLLVFVLLATRRGGFAARTVQVPLYTASKGGSFVVLGNTLRDIAKADHAPIEFVPDRTDGSVANLKKIVQFKNAVGFTLVQVPSILRNEEYLQVVRSIAWWNTDVIYVVARRDIHDFAELLALDEGKPKHRVYVGLPESGTREAAHDVMKETVARGLAHGDVERILKTWANDFGTWGFEDAAKKLDEGELDATIFAVGRGAPVVEELTKNPKFHLIELDEAVRKSLIERDGYVRADAATDVPSVGAKVLIATHADTEPWIVEEMVHLLRAHASEIERFLTPSAIPMGSPPRIVTDPVRLDTGQLRAHEAVLRDWSWTRGAWFTSLFCLSLLGLQLGLLQRWSPFPAPVVSHRRPLAAGPPTAKKVFLSYAREDREKVADIAAMLSAAGLDVFFDMESLKKPSSDNYYELIQKSVWDCDLFVFFVSARSIENTYAVNELEWAKERWPNPAGRVLAIRLGEYAEASLPAFIRANVFVNPLPRNTHFQTSAYDYILEQALALEPAEPYRRQRPAATA